MVKNLLAMWETQVQSLRQEGPLEKGISSYSSILAWKVPWTEATVYRVTKSQVFKRKKNYLFIVHDKINSFFTLSVTCLSQELCTSNNGN